MIIRICIVFAFVLSFSVPSLSQTKIKTEALSKAAPVTAVKSSAAYAELLLRQTERTAELEELLLDYTEEFPKVKELRYELSLLKKESERVAAVKPAEAEKLTLALGKLIVRRVEIEVDLWNLKRQFSDEQPEVQRAKRRVEVFDRAVREILP